MAASLTGCALGDGGASAAGDVLAAQLSALDGAGEDPGAPSEATVGPLGDKDRAALEEVIAGMGGVDADVRVVGIEDGPSVDTAEGQATPTKAVQLTWTWALPAGPWTYTSTGLLTKRAEGWSLIGDPNVVHPSLGAGGTMALRRVPADRGDVLGAGGRVLVTERPVVRVGIDKTLLTEGEDPSAAGERLGTWVGLEDPAAFGRTVAAAGPRQFVEAIVVREEDYPLSPEPLEDLPGAVALPSERPLAPTSEFARPLLGRVGEATSEIVEESGGTVRPGTLTGLSGLQRRYEERLAGTAGQQVMIRDAEGATSVLQETAAVDGEPLHLTLDLGLQVLAERVLSTVEPTSALVAVRASTGEVVAAASGPGSEGLNIATDSLAIPGSTFKIATALALLREGMTPDSMVQCTDTVVIDGRRFGNNPDYPPGALGPITLRDAVANSCNTALLAQHETVSATELSTAAESLGLSPVPEDGAGYGFPYVGASIPADQSGLDHVASLIGQGRNEAAPLAVAVSMASVAAGHRVEPILVRDANDLGASPSASPTPERPLSPEEAAALQDMLRAVVTEGSSTFLADVPGQPVIAKSGTGQYGTGDPPATNAWMVAAQGDLAVVVYVAEGVYGTVTAGPLIEEFLREAPGSATDSSW